jgi:hypothetical protein
MSPERSVISHLLGWTALLATLVVTPWASIDPINVPKLAVIAIGGFMVLALLMSSRKVVINKNKNVVVFISGLFVCDLLVVFLFAGSNPNQEFFGTYGRATGLVAYLALTALLLGSAVSASNESVRSFSKYLFAAGGLSIGYGFIQSIGSDPISWVNQYNPVIGFLGNPNFQSSFVGFVGVMAFALILNQKATALVRGSYSIYFLLAVIVIIKTDSQQGLLVLAGGMAIVVLIWLSTSKLKVLITLTFGLKDNSLDFRLSKSTLS